MSLVDLIRKNKNIKIATANPPTQQPENTETVAKIATVAIANATESRDDTDSNIERIRSWLYQIGEPEEDHHLIIEKCRNHPEVMHYFLKHATNGEAK
jgi:hypothetical protein